MLGSSARQRLFSKLRPRENFPLRAYSDTRRQVTNSAWFPQAAAMVHRPYQCVKQQYWRGFAALWPFWPGISGARDEKQNCAGPGSFNPGEVAVQDRMVQNPSGFLVSRADRHDQ